MVLVYFVSDVYVGYIYLYYPGLFIGSWNSQRDLTHWGWVTHICVSKLTIIGSDNGLSPARRQAITYTNAGILLIWPLGTNFSEILIGIQTFSFMEIHLKMSSAKWRSICLGPNVLNSASEIYSYATRKTHRNTNRVHAFWTYFKIKYKKWILVVALKQNIWFYMKVLPRISRRSLVEKCWHKKYLTSLLDIFWVQNQTVHYVHHQIEILSFDILGLRTPTICIGILQLHHFR